MPDATSGVKFARPTNPRPAMVATMTGTPIIRMLLLLGALSVVAGGAPEPPPSLALPVVGGHEMRVITPTVLELTLVTTKQPDPAPVEQWNFVAGEGNLTLPPLKQFAVRVGEESVSVKSVGFKRRVLYAPLRRRDLRIGNYLYLELATPIVQGAAVQVLNPDHSLWPESMKFSATAEDKKWSPALHVNQVGYAPQWPKKAMVGPTTSGGGGDAPSCCCC